jgi:hypothetical protein
MDAHRSPMFDPGFAVFTPPISALENARLDD